MTKGFILFGHSVALWPEPRLPSDRRNSENDALSFACVWSSVITSLMLPVQPPAMFGRKHVGNLDRGVNNLAINRIQSILPVSAPNSTPWPLVSTGNEGELLKCVWFVSD